MWPTFLIGFLFDGFFGVGMVVGLVVLTAIFGSKATAIIVWTLMGAFLGIIVGLPCCAIWSHFSPCTPAFYQCVNDVPVKDSLDLAYTFKWGLGMWTGIGLLCGILIGDK